MGMTVKRERDSAAAATHRQTRYALTEAMLEHLVSSLKRCRLYWYHSTKFSHGGRFVAMGRGGGGGGGVGFNF